MAAPFQNYNRAANNPNSPFSGAAQAPMANPARSQTSPNWGSTFLNDLIIRPEFQGSVLEEFFERSQFVSSGIIARNSAMDLSAGGTVVQVPFFKAAEMVEEEIDSTDSWGQSSEGYLSPQRVGMSSYQVPVIHRGFAGAADDLSRLGSGEDPLGALRSYVADNMAKFRQNYLLSLLNAVFDDTNGALVGNSLGDIGAETGTDSASTTAANHISAAVVIGCQNLFGERGDDLKVLACHSAVRNQLRNAGLLTFSSPAAPTTSAAVSWGGGGIGVSDSQVENFAGMRLVTSDQLVLGKSESGAASGDAMKYPCYIFGEGSVQEGVQSGLRIETERNVLSKQDIFAADYHYLLGIPGINWKGSGFGGTFPKNTDIATATNWELAWAYREFVPISRVIVNSPFGGNYA